MGNSLSTTSRRPPKADVGPFEKLQHEVQPSTTSKRPPKADVFPFEKRPQEVQTMIIRESMPQHGLLPNRPRCGPKLASGYNNTIPSSLFSVNRAISAEAQFICQKEVYLIIQITPVDTPVNHHSTIAVLNTELEFGFRLGYPSHLLFANIQPFRKLRNFKIDLMITERIDRRSFWLEQLEHEKYKERLRLICDTLATYNNEIQQLRIRIPCLCELQNAEMVLLAKIQLLDLLSPLRRLRVAGPISYDILHQETDGQRVICSHDRGKDASQSLGQTLCHVKGEKLSKEELTWRKASRNFQAQAKRVRSFVYSQRQRANVQRRKEEKKRLERQTALEATQQTLQLENERQER
ncbi:MAG: hypothetical protein L6R40_006596 [Gallowayella cf. fulva]|nr:MAG: hypothetical protein L6R40_006596 [Xanthomendoza cf. fulva]